MNRVLNKGFEPESYLNSALIAISGVFRPASCMQICYVQDLKGLFNSSFEDIFLQHTKSASHAG
jgi:hypothetical protein